MGNSRGINAFLFSINSKIYLEGFSNLGPLSELLLEFQTDALSLSANTAGSPECFLPPNILLPFIQCFFQPNFWRNFLSFFSYSLPKLFKFCFKFCSKLFSFTLSDYKYTVAQRAASFVCLLPICRSVGFCTLLCPICEFGTASPVCSSVCKAFAPKGL